MNLQEDESKQMLDRLVNIELKVNNILEIHAANNSFSGHPDQAFGHLTYSQHGEDLIIVNIFQLLGYNNPSYIDLGAHDPINISNTALLYRRGSRGINVEANPNLISAFLERRPEDVNVNLGVGPLRGKRDFYCIDKWSGRNTFDKRTAESFVRQHPDFQIREVLQIEIQTLNDIIERYRNGIFPDFMNIDTEGLEYEILASVDFSSSKPLVICVETVSGDDQDQSDRLVELLRLKGYVPYVRTLGNIIFLSSNAHRRLWSKSGVARLQPPTRPATLALGLAAGLPSVAGRDSRDRLSG